jgi:hypothetical protein
MRHLWNLLASRPGTRSVRLSHAATIACALVLAVSTGVATAAAHTPAPAVTQIKSVYRAVLTAEYFGPASELCSNLTRRAVKYFTLGDPGHGCVYVFKKQQHALTHKIPDEDDTGYSPTQWRGLVVEILDHLKVTVHGTHATAIGGDSGIPGQTDLVEVNGRWLFNDYPPSIAS